MKKRVWVSLISFFTAAACLLLVPTSADSPGLLAQEGIRPVRLAASSAQLPNATSARVVSSYGKLPLSFEPNQGQTGKRIKFLSRGRGYALFLTSDEAILGLTSAAQVSPWKSKKSGTDTQPSKPDTLRMKLLGANQEAQITGVDKLPGKSNYLIGKDPQKWRTNVPTYAKVRYRNVYPGIDLVYYGNQRQLEYDFVVAPGADPKAITLEIGATSGTAPARLAENGDLVIKTGKGEVRLLKPVVYQAENSELATSNRKSIKGRFVLLAKDRIGFEVPNYDRNQPLVIDPVLEYSTFLGGSNRYEEVRAIAVDSSGNAYVTGYTESSDFPLTVDPFDGGCGTDGQCNWNETGGFSTQDVFVTKLNSNGTSLLYSTYLGGSNLEWGRGIAVDSSGNAYVTGNTWSGDFPVLNPIQDHWGGSICGPGPEGAPCSDAFVTKLNPTGSGLVYSTYLGGNWQDGGQGIALDSSGNAYVIGSTQSADFPTVSALDPAFHGGTCGPESDTYPCPDVFVAKIGPQGAAVYSTYLGGSRDEGWSGDIAVDGEGSAYITGATGSADFPVTEGALNTNASGFHAFVTKIAPSGASLAYSTFLGGTYNGGEAIAVDTLGSAYVAGRTWAPDFPTTPGAYDRSSGTNWGGNGQYDAFVSKLNGDGSALDYSTYLGGSGRETPYDIAVDSLGIAYVTGSTDSPDFPDFPGQPFGGQRLGGTCANNQGTYPCPDAFMSKLSAGGEGLIVSGYLAGSSEDVGYGIALDPSRNVYIVGHTDSNDFPTTSGAYQTTSRGAGDGFVVKLSDLALSSVILSAESLDFGEQLVGTTTEPMIVTVKNIGDAAETVPPLQISGDFLYQQTCGAIIAPGSSCTIEVIFAPRAEGISAGQMASYEEGSWHPFLTMRGVGIAPHVLLTPTNIGFGSQAVGNSGDPVVVRLSNTGSAPLTITSIAISKDFIQTNNCGAMVPTGSSCLFNVSFRPIGIGARTGKLSISSNAPDSPHVVFLSGTGYLPSPPLLLLSSRFLNFGTIPMGGGRTVQASLINGGGSPLRVYNLVMNGPTYFHLGGNCDTLQPGARCVVTVTFFGAPSPGFYFGTLYIYSGARSSPDRLPMRIRVSR